MVEEGFSNTHYKRIAIREFASSNHKNEWKFTFATKLYGKDIVLPVCFLTNAKEDMKNQVIIIY